MELLTVAVNIQIILQVLAGNVDPVLDRTDRNGKLFCDLMVFEAFKVHHKGIAVFSFQFGDCFLDVFHGKCAGSSVFSDTLGGVDVMQIVGSIDECVPSYHAVVLGNEGILHDRIQPSLQIGARGELLAVGDCFEHGLLHQVVGHIRIAGQLHREWLQKLCQTLDLNVEFDGVHMFS